MRSCMPLSTRSTGPDRRRARRWLRGLLHDLEVVTRPQDPEVDAAYRARWDELPDGVRTPAQMLGRKLTGCEADRHGESGPTTPTDGRVDRLLS